MSKPKLVDPRSDANGLLLHAGDAVFVLPGDKTLGRITGFTKNELHANVTLLATESLPEASTLVPCQQLRLRSVFDYAKDGQHLADVRAAQDGPPREGWASTKPGQTKYHHYDAKGKSQCNYQRQPGPLHYAPDPGQLMPQDCCSACDLAILKAKSPEQFNSHPSLPIARQSKWQQKQYGTPTAQAAPAPEKSKRAALVQLDLFGGEAGSG